MSGGTLNGGSVTVAESAVHGLEKATNAVGRPTSRQNSRRRERDSLRGRGDVTDIEERRDEMFLSPSGSPDTLVDGRRRKQTTGKVQELPCTERSARMRRKRETQLETRPRAQSVAEKMVDVFSFEVPRRPRSRRSTTVVKLRDFSFRDLPTLLDESSQRSPRRTATPSPIRKSEEVAEVKPLRKESRKPKSNATPQRLVTRYEEMPLSQSRNGRRRWARALHRSEDFLSDAEPALLDAVEKREIRVSTRKRRGRPPKFGSGVGRKGKRQTRRRSLKSVIQACVDEEKCRKAPTRSLPFSRRTTRETASSALERRRSSTSTSAVSRRVDRCPTVSCLLTKGALKAGDYVELTPVDTDLRIHGWVTHRGILCSNCALIHCCKLFGACAAVQGDVECLHTKDGCSLSKLMQ